jgi:hypothetical protein
MFEFEVISGMVFTCTRTLLDGDSLSIFKKKKKTIMAQNFIVNQEGIHRKLCFRY